MNAEELEALQKDGVPFFGCNIGVGLSIPGFRTQIARGLIEKMDFGVSSIIGVSSMEETVKVKSLRHDCRVLGI